MLEFITDRIAYSAEAQAIFDFKPSKEIFVNKHSPSVVSVGKTKIAPWGEDNLLPNNVVSKVDDNEVVGANILFNIQAAYGNGIVPMKRIKEGNDIRYVECDDKEVLAFFEDNDINNFFLEQITDMVYFFNVFPELIVNNKGDKIVSLKSLEALNSRWGIDNGRGITEHYYADWADNKSKSKAVRTSALDTRFTNDDITTLVEKGERRFVLKLSMPTPGRNYYARPYWYSIFKSGWYDIARLIPTFKKAIIKNNMSVRYIVYISESYWDEVCRRDNLGHSDVEKRKEAIDNASKKIIDFLSNESSQGGALLSTAKFTPSGNSVFEDKYIRIETVDSKMKDGEFIDDTEQANNIMSYALGVHPSLNGATPGKTSGSLGGSDKRELMMIKQATMRPFRDQLLKTLYIIKKFNGWDEDIVFRVSEYQFPTLDVAKSGKIESVK